MKLRFQKPRLDIKDIFAALLISLGLILFLVNLHIMAIETEGNISSVMTTTFIILLRVSMSIIIFAMAFLIIQFLKYLAWQAMTPAWMKKKIARNNK